MPAPEGDFLARMFLGSDMVNEIDFREKAGRKARVAAGKQWRAMKAQEAQRGSPGTSSSHYSSEVVSRGRPSQRKGASAHNMGQDQDLCEVIRDVPPRRENTHLTARSSQKLIQDPYGVERSVRGERGGDGSMPAGHSVNQVRASQQRGRSQYAGPQAGRSEGVEAADYADVPQNLYAEQPSNNQYQGQRQSTNQYAGQRQSHAATLRDHAAQYQGPPLQPGQRRSQAAILRDQAAPYPGPQAQYPDPQVQYPGPPLQPGMRQTQSASKRGQAAIEDYNGHGVMQVEPSSSRSTEYSDIPRGQSRKPLASQHASRQSRRQ